MTKVLGCLVESGLAESLWECDCADCVELQDQWRRDAIECDGGEVSA